MQTEHLNTLIAQRAALDAQIKETQRAAKSEVLKTAAQAFALHGITREEAAAYFSKNSTTGVKVAPKYRHKATGQTWTGRGKQPTWYRDSAQDEIEHLDGGLK